MVVLKSNIGRYHMLTNTKLIKVRLNKLTVDIRIESLIAPFQNRIRGRYCPPITNTKYHELPHIVAFNNGKHIYLVDGWFKYRAAKRAKIDEVECEIIFGTLREATQYSLSRADQVNPRSRYGSEFIHKRIRACINDPKWGQLSDRWIARMCGVSNALVNKIHNEIIEEICRRVTEEELV
jgi:hypothetical protein